MNKKTAIDWTLGHAAYQMGNAFKSFETLVQECIWSDDTGSQRILEAISNEENQ